MIRYTVSSMVHHFDLTEISQVTDWLGSGSINLFGLPFAGKDTQGRLLADLFDAHLLGGGDILRGSVIPPQIRAIMDAGELIPTNDYLQIVLPYLEQDQFQGRPLILSSVGRWHGEEAGVIEATAQAGHPLKAVIHLQLDPETMRARWSKDQEERSRGDRGNRSDDAAGVIETRLAEFEQKTLSVIDFYREQGLLHEVDATAPAVEVTAAILEILAARASAEKL